ncbi:MAG: DUF4438 domain-containing protein [Acidobacteria bacterium]|nr:DUF4438 domain-containing protein [Acidobacteriota bacterium]
MKKALMYAFVFLLLQPIITKPAFNQSATKSLKTNKDKVMTIAVQGQIAPAQPARSYAVTWDGKPKMMVGTGGINYNLGIGAKIFGWASADRATVGVATEGIGENRFSDAWLTYTAIGNEVKILGGEAKGEKGVVVGKFGGYVLLHFDAAVVERLAVGDKVQAKAGGIGLAIDGFKDVFAHGVAPDLLERIGSIGADGKIEIPVVRVIPAEIVGQGSGGSSLSGNWHIQTCYPPDIKEHGLDELRFGDLVFLKDIETDYGKGYYRGGATVGVVCSGPSDISGLGIGVTPILSTRLGRLTARLDPTANISKHLGIAGRETSSQMNPGPIKTNRDKLIVTAVEGVVQPAGSRGYSVTADGKPTVVIGMGSINYTVSLGDPAYGWANADHVEPDVTIQGRDRPSPSDCALAILACIGNQAQVLSGDARGAKGIFIGRHAGSHDMVWFPRDVLEKLAVNDRIQVRAQGVGLKIDGFDDVRVNKMSPELIEKMGLEIRGKTLVVPVVMEVPGHIMGSGMGGSFLENVDYDIQTTCPETVEQYGLKKLRLGDIVAIRDHYDFYGRGRYQGAVTIGVVIHGFSDLAGHGPGVNPLLSALPGRILTRIDPDANTAYYLGIRKK